jgi:hypothetical protein
MDQYVRDTKDFDAIRETSQRRQEMQTAAAKAAVTMHVDLLGLTDDPRQKLFTKLQDASNHVLIMRLQQLSATVSLTTLSSPKEIADIVKALDQLARELSPSDQTKELIEYFKEVYNDLNNDQKAKSAENSISKAGASSK